MKRGLLSAILVFTALPYSSAAPVRAGPVSKAKGTPVATSVSVGVLHIGEDGHYRHPPQDANDFLEHNPRFNRGDQTVQSADNGKPRRPADGFIRSDPASIP